MSLMKRMLLILILSINFLFLLHQNVFAVTNVQLNYGGSYLSTSDNYGCFYHKIMVNKPFILTSVGYQGSGSSVVDRVLNAFGTVLGEGTFSILLQPNTYYWVGFIGEDTYQGGQNGGDGTHLYVYYSSPTKPNSAAASGVTFTTYASYEGYDDNYSVLAGINPISFGSSGKSFNLILTGYAMPNGPALYTPLNNSYVGTYYPAFSAGVTDPEGESCKVQFQYSKISDFSSGVWSIDSAYVASGATASAIPATSLTAGQWYWRAKSIKANGTESGWSPVCAFNIDAIKPSGSLSINNGAPFTASTGVTLQIAGTDADSGVSQMRFSNDGAAWGSWVSYASSYSHTLTSTNGTKTVYMQLKDNAENISNTITDTIVLDNVVPDGTISINSGAMYTNNFNVVLTLTYSDATSGPYQMQVSTVSDFAGASWMAVGTTANITLTAGDGTKTVYTRFKDNAGNISTSKTDTIILDKVNPTGSITVLSVEGLSKTASTSVVLTLAGSDDRAGLAGIQLSNNGMSWGSIETLTSPKNWTVSVGAGTKTVYLKLIDNAGNEFVVSDDIYLVDDVVGPTVTISVNGGATSTTDSSVTLNITAFDNFAKFNELQMRFSNDGYLWSGWKALANTENNWDITNASYGGTSTAGTKSVYVQVVDAAQNIGLGRVDIGYSSQTPSGNVTLNTGVAGTFNGENVRFVAKPNVNLALSFSNVSDMRVSLDGVSYSPWLPYSSILPITLPKGDGLTTVGVQVQNINRVVSDTTKYLLVLDTTPPSFSVKTTNGATATTTGSVGLTILATDNISTENFQYKINDGSWLSLPTNGVVFATGLTNGYNQIVISIKDQAGNIGKKTINIWRI